MLGEPDPQRSIAGQLSLDGLTPQLRVLLIGTALTVRQLHQMLSLVDPSPHVVGAILASHSQSPLDLPLPVLGHTDQVMQILVEHPVDQVLVTLPVSLASQIRQTARVLDSSGVAWRLMPTLADQFAGRVPQALILATASENRSTQTQSCPSFAPVTTAPWMIDPVQLLNRRPQPLDEQAIRRTVASKVVLITGAGGSIGSEIARMVSRYEPAKLVLVERSENILFEIDRELGRLFPDLSRAAILHDVTNVHRTLAMVTLQRPNLIFHAAAHQHVPMMEDHPAQTVENNFYGTRAVADAAVQIGVERFVMISTDKAVNPNSVMGASKRLAELYIQYLGAEQNSPDRCVFSMVRFGNVLGSACSVLPIWIRQLASGDPLTVTHPDMLRYFMTISEAAGLVLQSAALAKGGEVFLLDMGKPIRILDLARRFVQSHGLAPELDVQFQITGIRPGEKLCEELAYDSEDMLPTLHPSIRIWRTIASDPARIRHMIRMFDLLRRKVDARGDHWERAGQEGIFAALRDALPGMMRADNEGSYRAAAG